MYANLINGLIVVFTPNQSQTVGQTLTITGITCKHWIVNTSNINTFCSHLNDHRMWTYVYIHFCWLSTALVNVSHQWTVVCDCIATTVNTIGTNNATIATHLHFSNDSIILLNGDYYIGSGRGSSHASLFGRIKKYRMEIFWIYKLTIYI